MAQEKPSLFSILDDILMVVLALVSAGILFVEYATPTTVPEILLLDQIDIGIAVIFLLEFCIKLLVSNEKGKYFKGHWWELFASIPITTPTTQSLRLLRLLRLIRLLRLNEGFREIFDYLERFAKQTHLIGVFFTWLFILLLGSAGFYSLEHGVNPHVLSPFDSFWWAIGVMTTMGAGDIYPFTVAGRILAIVLMICGVGITGIFTALVASFFITDSKS